MTTQLTLPNITDVRTPWPLGVWLRVYTNSLHADVPTIIGRLVGYGLSEDQTTVKLVNAHGGAEVPIYHVVGVVSPVDARPRTGFPKVCPIARAAPVLAINCDGCEYRRRDERGYWRCDHVGYQAAPGIHFCLGCGRELCLYFQSKEWPYCGGPQGRCLKANEEQN